MMLGKYLAHDGGMLRKILDLPLKVLNTQLSNRTLKTWVQPKFLYKSGALTYKNTSEKRQKMKKYIKSRKE